MRWKFLSMWLTPTAFCLVGAIVPAAASGQIGAVAPASAAKTTTVEVCQTMLNIPFPINKSEALCSNNLADNGVKSILNKSSTGQPARMREPSCEAISQCNVFAMDIREDKL
jgi:hypothetical protein